MYLYNLTLQKTQCITHAVFGNFSAPKAQEILVARGKVLELLRPDDESGKVISILSTEIYGVIRDLKTIRHGGGNRDYIVMGTDSGKISILRYNDVKNRFDKVHEECFGKTGSRRIVPGQYIACDPKGRCVMIGSIEKSKLVYVLNQDSQAKLTISSPLEAHKANSVVFSMCGVDSGLENPMFACIEASYDELPSENEKKVAVGEGGWAKNLVFYEVDLGLNHVTRKWSSPTDKGANIVITVPGGKDGPGGVLVCAENWIIYKNQGHDDVKAMIPRRFGMADDKGILPVCTATHVQKKMFFFLIQTELGDLYKVTLDFDEDAVNDVIVKYFDTIPPAASMCVLKTGFLFSASEFANSFLFQFQGIGEDDDTPFSNSKMDASDIVYMQPRALTNLVMIDEMESLSPVTDMLVADLAKEHTPQIYTLCGRGPRSSLRILRHGLAVTEMARSELPGNPQGAWAVRSSSRDEYHEFIVISFVDRTLVLRIDETVTEVSDSGVSDSTPTLSMSLLGDNSLLQIHPNGIRHILGQNRIIKEWKTPGKKAITKCAVNERQVVIALTGGELVYFELDKGGSLVDVHRKEMGSDVASLALGPVPEGRQRSLFLVVGSFDNTVRVLSLNSANSLAPVGTTLAVPAQPTSILLIDQPTFSASSSAAESKSNSASSAAAAAATTISHLYLYVGLQNGVVIRSTFDDADGKLIDPRRRFLGTKPVKLVPVKIRGQNAVLAISSRSWLYYRHQNRLHDTPLSYDALEGASTFSSAQCPEAIVAIAGNLLRIVTIDRLGELFNQSVVPLRYTPRKMIVHPLTNHLIIIESDHNAYPYDVKQTLQKDQLSMLKAEEDEAEEEEGEEGGDSMDTDGTTKKRKMKQEGGAAAAAAEEEDEEKKQQQQAEDAFMGVPQAGAGKWASCIRIVNPADGTTLFLQELADNEAAFSLCTVVMKDEQLYLAVGTCRDLNLSPRSLTNGSIHMYQFTDHYTKLQLLHKTIVQDAVLALTPFQNRLLAGVGNSVRLFELGKRKLLKKCDNKQFPTTVCNIDVYGDRIYVADSCESFFYCTYKKQENVIDIFAESLVPRYITASCHIDYDTMCGADKFGNVFVSRLPADTSSLIEKDPTGGQRIGTYGEFIKKTVYKLGDAVEFHVGDMVTAMKKASLVPGGTQVIVYSTLMGGIGILVPFSSREDIEFFSHLEMHMRQESSSLGGRDHLSYRSYYNPVKDCVDGDMCSEFLNIEHGRQSAVAEELASKTTEVLTKLEEIRNRVM